MAMGRLAIELPYMMPDQQTVYITDDVRRFLLCCLLAFIVCASIRRPLPLPMSRLQIHAHLGRGLLVHVTKGAPWLPLLENSDQCDSLGLQHACSRPLPACLATNTCQALACMVRISVQASALMRSNEHDQDACRAQMSCLACTRCPPLATFPVALSMLVNSHKPMVLAVCY